MLPILWRATWQPTLLAVFAFVVIRLVGRWVTPSCQVALSAIPMLRLVVLVLPVTAFSLFQWVERPRVQIQLPVNRSNITNDSWSTSHPADRVPFTDPIQRLRGDENRCDRYSDLGDSDRDGGMDHRRRPSFPSLDVVHALFASTFE